MSAFLAYGGVYEFAGRQYRWRCYATARVHAIRKREHGPNPEPPDGLQWIVPEDRRSAPPVVCLMDADVGEFSQMLVQVEPQAIARSPVRRPFPPAGPAEEASLRR